MEALIALVAASFVRHGIDSPGDLQLARPNSLQTVRPAESTLTTHTRPQLPKRRTGNLSVETGLAPSPGSRQPASLQVTEKLRLRSR